MGADIAKYKGRNETVIELPSGLKVVIRRFNLITLYKFLHARGIKFSEMRNAGDMELTEYLMPYMDEVIEMGTVKPRIRAVGKSPSKNELSASDLLPGEDIMIFTEILKFQTEVFDTDFFRGTSEDARGENGSGAGSEVESATE